MGHVIVKLKVMVDDSMISMIELEQVFESSGSLFLVGFDVVDLDRFDGNCCTWITSQEAGKPEGV